MVSESLREFFAASGGTAGALIGLLFVAISVSSERLARAKAGRQVYRIRASAALTAFINALAVSLFALIPGNKIGATAVTMAAVGLMFVTASLASLVRLRKMRWATLRDVLFLLGLIVTLVIQLIRGAEVIARPGDSGAVNVIAILVVVCFLIGITRSWELVGGPSIGVWQEITALFRDHERDADNSDDDEPPV